MINPKWLDSIPDDIVDLWSEAEETALADAARMIRKYGAIPTSLGEMQTLRASGTAQKEINSALAPLVGKSEKTVASIIQKAGNAVVKGDSDFYKMADIYRTTDVDKEALNMVLRQGTQSTLQNLRQIIRATAQNGSQQVYDAIDKAQLMVSSGLFSSDQAVRDAVKTLADHGLDSITYTDGHGHVTQKVSIETAVRRAVQTGTNQTALKISEELADDVGCDLVEVSAHQGARPSHAMWQGKIYSRSGKSDKYPKLSTATGYGTITGLGGVNCRHTFGPWVEGCSRTWSDEELEELQQPSVTYNGKKMTEYEASQVQRKIERTIRKWKREKAMCEAAGLDTTEADMKIREWQDKQKDFIKQTGFKRDYAREQIYISNAGFSSEAAVQNMLHNEASQSAVSAAEERLRSTVHDTVRQYSAIADDNTHKAIERAGKKAAKNTSDDVEIAKARFSAVDKSYTGILDRKISTSEYDDIAEEITLKKQEIESRMLEFRSKASAFSDAGDREKYNEEFKKYVEELGKLDKVSKYEAQGKQYRTLREQLQTAIKNANKTAAEAINKVENAAEIIAEDLTEKLVESAAEEQIEKLSFKARMIKKDLDKAGVSKLEISDIIGTRTEEEIIAEISGGDMTGGSCASAAWTYIGQKSGWDVHDFRGGLSRDFFCKKEHGRQIARLPGVKSTFGKEGDAIGEAVKLLEKAEKNKSYYFSAGKHAAIIKIDSNGILQYLELQSNVQNGWKYFTNEDTFGARGHTMDATRRTSQIKSKLKSRFKADGSVSAPYMVDVDSIVDNSDFKSILEYINTDVSKQNKGINGHEK